MGAHHLEMLVHAVPKKLDLSSYLRGLVVFLGVVRSERRSRASTRFRGPVYR